MIENIRAFKKENFNKDNIAFFFERMEKYLVSSMIFKGACNKERLIKYMNIPLKLTTFQHNDYFFFAKDELIKTSIMVKDNLKEKGTSYIQKIHDDCIKKGTEFVSEAKSIAKEHKEGKIDELESFKQYSDLCIDFCTYYFLALFEKAFTSIAQELAEKYQTKEYPKERLFELFTTSSKNTAAEDEMDDFLKIAIKKLQGGDVDSDVEEHLKKYNWISLRYFYGEPWTKQDILDRINSYTLEKAKDELKIRKDMRNKVEKDMEEITKTMEEKDKEMIKQTRNVVFLRTYRADVFQNASLYIIPILKELAESWRIGFHLVRALSYKEVLDFKEEYKELAEQRVKNIFISHWDEEALAGKEVDEVMEKYPFLKVQHIKSEELKGNIAFKGKAKGHAKIIKVNEDIQKVEKGDILVAVMTTPNFVPAMEKAAAFVTDEGGILCHASIIAREMRKPCLIATKNATRAFKDGDIIEVDANEGVVKKVK